MGPSSARKETRGIGSYPWFSTNSLLYHTHVCHSEPSGEYPGQSDPCPPTLGLFGFSRFSGLFGSMNERNEINQTNRLRSSPRAPLKRGALSGGKGYLRRMLTLD